LGYKHVTPTGQGSVLIKLETWMQNAVMKRIKTSKEIKVERPYRATVSEKGSLEANETVY